MLEEAQKLAAIPPHDNVVKVHDAGRWDNRHVFIASDVCTGGSLEDRFGGVAMDPAAACRVVSDACRGLDHLHQHGLLHLDLRPANILMERETPRLVDFGLARWVHDSEVDDWYGPHAAPELVEAGSASTASDTFEMAMTLAHLLTGGSICRPFPVSSDLLQASADGDWPRLSELTPNVPLRLRQILKQATDYQLETRPQPVSEFKRLLDRATPAVSFHVPDGDGRLISNDGVWSISTTAAPGGHSVEVRKKGRRRRPLGIERVSAAKARAHVAKVVRQFAESAP